jgi:hypothetical protein
MKLKPSSRNSYVSNALQSSPTPPTSPCCCLDAEAWIKSRWPARSWLVPASVCIPARGSAVLTSVLGYTWPAV